MIGRGALRPLLRLGPIALCALTAHAALYRSLLPADGTHGYFGWYEPAVAALSLASALAVAVAAVAAALGRRSRTLAALSPTTPTPMTAARLGTLAIGWLVVQETIERSLANGSFEAATFGSGSWAIVVGTAAIAAGALTLLARIGASLVRTFDAVPPKRLARAVAAARPATNVRPRKRQALADRRGLRAPPATA